ncbi:MAG: zinc ribbon domain-containing protein [Planctomycetota bacterium]
MDVPRLYLSNDSYPELREIHPRWTRSVTWWRAITLGVRHARFWGFVTAQIGLAFGCFFAARTLNAVDVGRVVPDGLIFTFFGAGWLIVFAYLQISWGGDMMRSYLRAVSDKARYACPQCGHSLFGHVGGDADRVRCPECGADVARDVFDWPHPIPLRYRAFPRPEGERGRAGQGGRSRRLSMPPMEADAAQRSRSRPKPGMVLLELLRPASTPPTYRWGWVRA